MREVLVASTVAFCQWTSSSEHIHALGQTLQSSLDYVKRMNSEGRDQASRESGREFY
jgi:hypothetical protein